MAVDDVVALAAHCHVPVAAHHRFVVLHYRDHSIHLQTSQVHFSQTLYICSLNDQMYLPVGVRCSFSGPTFLVHFVLASNVVTVCCVVYFFDVNGLTCYLPRTRP